MKCCSMQPEFELQRVIGVTGTLNMHSCDTLAPLSVTSGGLGHKGTGCYSDAARQTVCVFKFCVSVAVTELKAVVWQDHTRVALPVCVSKYVTNTAPSRSWLLICLAGLPSTCLY
jgi:hypothetical protein